MKFESIIHRCLRCGYCKLPSNYIDFNCPSYLSYRFETYSPGGRMWLIREWLDKRIDSSKRFQEIIYSCATCFNCVFHCAMPDFRELLLDVFRETKERLIEQGDVPPPVRDYLENLYKFKNGFGVPNKNRFKWSDSLPEFDLDKHEYLLYVGDECCFDYTANKMAISTIELFKKLGISFGVLGQQEISDGVEAYNLGEIELFKETAADLVRRIKSSNVREVIVLSPHTLYAFKEIYPKIFDFDFKSYLYVEIIKNNLSLLKPGAGKDMGTISYHDPCYLARHLKDVSTVRSIFNYLKIPLIEPPRNKTNTLCCGGGGGNFYTGLTQKGEDNSAKQRLREIYALDVHTLVTVCPICFAMLIDAKKSIGKKIGLEVVDLSSFLLNFA